MFENLADALESLPPEILGEMVVELMKKRNVMCEEAAHELADFMIATRRIHMMLKRGEPIDWNTIRD